MKHIQSKTRRGYSIVELTIVLGVVGIALGGIWALTSRMQQTNAVHLTSVQMILLNKNIRNFYQTRPFVLAGNRTLDLLAANPAVIPNEMQSGAVMVDLWGGGMQVAGGGAAGATAYTYTVQFNALAPARCAELVPILTTAGEVSKGLQAVTINTVPLNRLPPAPTAIIGTAVGQCGQNATAVVALTYRLRLGD